MNYNSPLHTENKSTFLEFLNIDMAYIFIL